MISRCSETRDRNMNRREWSSEKTTDATKRGYRRTSITSIDATRTMFSIATGGVYALVPAATMYSAGTFVIPSLAVLFRTQSAVRSSCNACRPSLFSDAYARLIGP